MVKFNDFTRQRRKSVMRSLDVQRIARAVQSRGIDTRLWVSYGTVGVLNDQGEFVVDDGQAIFPVPNGIVVDVRLEPSGHLITANYHGVAAGRLGSILFPIIQGDQVLVIIPDGDLNSASVACLPLGSNATPSAQIPSDFSNDNTPRVLIDLKCPLDIRVLGAVRIDSVNLKLNGRTVVRGTDPI